jgi:hypothetical protein
MSDERDSTKEYDQKHGTPKGVEPAEVDTTSTAMPLHSRPMPIAPKTSGGVD